MPLSALPPIRTSDGSLVEFGLIRHDLVFNPLIHTDIAALPGGMNYTVGQDAAYSIRSVSEGKPGLVMNNDVDVTRWLQFPAVHVERLTAIYMEFSVESSPASGGTGSLNTVQLRMTKSSAGERGYTVQVKGGKGATTDIIYNSKVVPTTYSPNFVNNDWHGLTLGTLWAREHGAAYVFEGKSVVALADLDETFIEPDIINPRLVPYAVGGTVQLLISGARMTCWYD